MDYTQSVNWSSNPSMNLHSTKTIAISRIRKNKYAELYVKYLQQLYCLFIYDFPTEFVLTVWYYCF